MIARPSRGLLVLADVALVGWLAACVVLGILVAREVRDVQRLGDTIVLASGALRQTADLVQELERLPIVGDRADELADRVRRTARSANRNVVVSKQSIRRLSLLLGASIALLPTVPLALVYLPARLAWIREARDVRAALARADEGVEALLALRAATNLPLRRLTAVSDDPWADLSAGRHRALADAELRRVGIKRPRSS